MDPIEELEGLGSPEAIQAWLSANYASLSSSERSRIQTWLASNALSWNTDDSRLADTRDSRYVPLEGVGPNASGGDRSALVGRRRSVVPRVDEDPVGYYQMLWRTNPNRAVRELRRAFPALATSQPERAVELGGWIQREAGGGRSLVDSPLNISRWLWNNRPGRNDEPTQQDAARVLLNQWWQSEGVGVYQVTSQTLEEAQQNGYTEEQTSETLRGLIPFDTADNPQWLQDATQSRVLTDEQKQRVVRYYNTFYVDNIAIDPDAPTAQVQSWEELLPILESIQGTAQLEQLIVGAIADVPLQTGFMVRMPDGESAFVDNDMYEYLRTSFGFDEQDVTFFAGFVSNNLSLGGVAPTGQRPDASLVVSSLPFYATILQANGLLRPMIEDERPAEPLLGPVADTSQTVTPWRAASGFARAEVERMQALDPQDRSFEQAEERRFRRIDVARQSRRQQDFSVEDNEQRRFERIGGVDRIGNQRPLTAERAIRMGDEGLRLYNNEGMAIIHASSTAGPSLAARILGNVVRGERWSLADAQEVQRIYIASGLAQNTRGAIADRFSELQGVGAMRGLGVFAVGQQRLDELERLRSRRPSGGGGGGGGAVRMMPDRTAVVQAVTDLYKQFFMQDPTPEEVNGLADSLIQRIMSTPTSQQVDSNAQLRAILSESPLYKELYGRMPEGFTEEELQRQVLQGQSAILGDDFRSKRAAQAGLADGRYQTAIGAAAASPEAFENSTFLGRLAQARQVLEAMT